MTNFTIALISDSHNEMEPPRNPSKEWLALDRARKSCENHPLKGAYLGTLKNNKPDLVVLAGDQDVGERSLQYAFDVQRYVGSPVVTIFGNHEGYRGDDLTILINNAKMLTRDGNQDVFFLENSSINFKKENGQVWVLGCTLWTDYELFGNDPRMISRVMENCRNGLNDHRKIYKDGHLFQPIHARNMHLESREWLNGEVARIRAMDADASIIIVTHHAPLPNSSAPEYEGNAINPAFASDMSKEIEQWKPLLWAFGHTHWSSQREIGPTKVISAQRGYVDYDLEANDFKPLMITLDISPKPNNLLK